MALPLLDLLPVFNAQPGATLLLSPEWVIVGASDDYLAATLTERTVIVGQYIFDAFPDNPAAPEANGVANVRASLEKVLATHQPHDMAPQHYDVPDRTQPGRFVERHWKPRHTPVLDAHGQMQYIIQSVQDITESRVAKQRLRESQAAEQAARADADEQRAALGRAFEQAPVSIAILRGPEFIVELANPSLGALWGRPVGPALGRPLFEALPDLAGQGLEELLAQALHTGEPLVFQERPTWLARDPAGPPALGYYNFTYQPLHDAQGQVTGLITVGLDVTEQVVARQQLQQLNQELEARVAARTREALALQADLLAAAQQQAAQRALLYQVFEQTPAPVALLRSPGHRFEYVNPAYQALFPGRLVGRVVADVAPELIAQGFGALLDRVYQTGETFFGTELPFAPTPVNGQPLRTLYFNFTYQAYREDDQVVGVSLFAFDVTEQVLARQERETQRQQLQAVFAQAPVAVCVFRGEDAVLDVVNPSMAEMLGHPLTALEGRPFFEALPELRAQGIPELLAGVRRTGTPYVAQEQAIQLARHPAGEPGYYDFVYQPLLDAQGHVAGIVCVATDVSTQVAARRLVEQREESFRLLADNVPAMLWVTDPDGQCTYLNAQWYAYTGQTEAEALGLGWTAAVHPDDAAAAGTAFLDANARRVPFSILYRLRRHDGKYRWAIDQGLPRFGPDGTFAGIVGTVVDVHEQKLAELALQKLTKQLRKSRDRAEALNAELGTSNQQLVRTNVDLDNFIYTASHDLKAPISNIEGLLYLLQEELPPAVTQEAEVGSTLTRMLESVERFKRTIDHLTEVSKLQKEHAPATTQVNLAAVVEDVRQDLAPLLQATGAKLVVDVPALPAILFSEKNLRSIVYNLLSNAVKYHSPDRPPRVDVRAHVRSGHTVLEVHDNGLGIAAHQLPKLFGMFQRLHDHVEGSGIGLFMVKRMVENAGGRIEVYSQLGAGTTFFVFLPHTARTDTTPFPAYLPS